MEKIETIEQARNYAQKILQCEKIEEVFSFDIMNSLSILAQSHDENHYRKIVDSFLRLTSNLIKDGKSNIRLSENPLSFLEFLCIGIDHGFPSLGYGWDGKKLPVQENQAYFNKLYGEHFY